MTEASISHRLEPAFQAAIEAAKRLDRAKEGLCEAHDILYNAACSVIGDDVQSSDFVTTLNEAAIEGAEFRGGAQSIKDRIFAADMASIRRWLIIPPDPTAEQHYVIDYRGFPAQIKIRTQLKERKD